MRKRADILIENGTDRTQEAIKSKKKTYQTQGNAVLKVSYINALEKNDMQ